MYPCIGRRFSFLKGYTKVSAFEQNLNVTLARTLYVINYAYSTILPSFFLWGSAVAREIALTPEPPPPSSPSPHPERWHWTLWSSESAVPCHLHNSTAQNRLTDLALCARCCQLGRFSLLFQWKCSYTVAFFSFNYLCQIWPRQVFM